PSVAIYVSLCSRAPPVSIFFFQAEDGIRDRNVTGVQTCALPILGEITHVDTTLISSLLDGGYIPVIATVGMDDLGQPYNVNADTAAAQIAIALKAEKLVSMTDIAGLLRDKDDESTLIPEVEVSEIEGYKAAGIIAGGMIPKIGGMADAIYQGVHEAVIIDGRVPHTVLLELFSNRGSGTRFY